ncbi:hypothetical protein F5878DRAFT_702565 [Lentinula raphanica]|uniref:Uncharacterized protein n=1 Tax=Lentinula raphanica TaxID=153919 RepID=A0AA38NY58_9AGAR|nr:hypothetical protein F5878DRAFT_702565 [Lentinula raphanica]
MASFLIPNNPSLRAFSIHSGPASDGEPARLATRSHLAPLPSSPLSDSTTPVSSTSTTPRGTEELNKLHHIALSDSASIFIRRLFYQAGVPWEAETHDLKALLDRGDCGVGGSLQAQAFRGPVEFHPDDVSKTKALGTRLQLADENVQNILYIQGMIGLETEMWVPSDHYRKAKSLAELVKLRVLMKIPKGN